MRDSQSPEIINKKLNAITGKVSAWNLKLAAKILGEKSIKTPKIL